MRRPTSERARPASATGAERSGARGAAGAASRSGDDGGPIASWRLVARWKAAGHRILPGVSYPISLWVVWRAAEMAVSLHLGGTPGHTAFFYDSEHYLRIMHIGYVRPRWIMPSHAFFPGLSALGWPIWKLTHSDLFTVHAVATVTGLAAFIAVWGVSKAWRDEQVARRAVLLFALFPSSLFLWAFYSEGLFIALGRRRGVGRQARPALAGGRADGAHRCHPQRGHPHPRGADPGPHHPPAARRPLGRHLRRGRARWACWPPWP